MSRLAVSQLLMAYPLEGDAPEVIITQGDDGKTYTRIPRGAHAKPKPWAWGGSYARTVRKARKLITTEPPTGLDEREKADLAEELEVLVEAAEKFLNEIESM